MSFCGTCGMAFCMARRRWTACLQAASQSRCKPTWRQAVGRQQAAPRVHRRHHVPQLHHGRQPRLLGQAVVMGSEQRAAWERWEA